MKTNKEVFFEAKDRMIAAIDFALERLEKKDMEFWNKVQTPQDALNRFRDYVRNVWLWEREDE